MKAMWKLAFRGRKQELKLLYRSVTLCSMLLAAVFLLMGSLQKMNRMARFDTYGSWRGAAFQVTEETERELKNHQAVTAYGEMRIFRGILKDNEIAGYAGTMDDALLSLGNIQLKEGRMPENKDEIAMETALLQVLGIPFRVGEICTLQMEYVDPDTGIVSQEEKVFTLCGILKTYTEYWDAEGNDLCGALLWQGAEGNVMETHLFFDSIHKNMEELEELRALIPLRSGTRLVYNLLAYPEHTGLLDKIDQGLAALLAFFLSLFLLFLTQAVLFQKRQYSWQVLRLLGADKGMLRKIWILEGLVVFLPSFLLGSLMGFAALWGAFFLYRLVSGQQLILYVRISAFLAAAGVSFLAFLGGSSYPMLFMGKIPLVPKGKDLTRYQVPHERRNAGRRFDWKHFCRKERKIYRRQNFYEGAFEFLAILLILSCFFFSYEKYRDYVISEKINRHDYSWTASWPNGLTEKQIHEIENMESITGLDRYTIVDSLGGENVYLTYNGWEEDTYGVLMTRKSETDENEIPKGMRGKLVMLSDSSELFEYYTDEGMNITGEEFEKGEKAVVYLPDIMAYDSGKTAYVNNFGVSSYPPAGGKYMETAIQSGTELEIHLGDRKKKIVCGGVLKRFDHEFQENRDFLMPGDVLVSKTFLESFLEREITVSNYVMAYGTPDITYEITDKKMSEISGGGQMTLEILREEKEQIRAAYVRTLLISGIFILFLFMISVMLSWHNRIGRMEQERQRFRLWKALGMKKERMMELYFFSYVKRLLSLLLLVHIFLSGIAVCEWIRSDSSHGAIWDLVRFQFRMGTIQFPWALYAGVQTGFVLLMLLCVWLPFWRAYKKES